MTQDLRSLLTDVAEGRLTPDSAAALIDQLPTGAPADRAADASTISFTKATPTESVTHVRITGSGRPVRVVADPTVATVTVEGPHAVRRDGATLHVDAAPLGSGALGGAGTAGGSADSSAGSYTYGRKTGLSKWLAQSTLVGVPLTVRVHPDLATDVEVMAGSLELVGLRGAVGFSVTAGSVRATDCSGPFTGSIRAGSAKFEVRPITGRSTVRVETGSVDLRLLPGSDVRITGRADLGEIKVHAGDGTTRVNPGGGLGDVVVGAGTATLDLQVAMGSAKVWLP